MYGFTYGNDRLTMVGDTLSVLGCDSSGKSTLYWKGGIPCLYRINRTKKGFAAVGDKGIVITSRDGFAWRRYSVPTQYRLAFVTATDSLYIIGCGGTIFTSPDCITWAEKKFTTVSINDATTNDSLVVAVGYNGAICTTRDGVNWSSRSSRTIDELNAVIWTGNGFIVGTGSTSTYGASDCILTSPDGITWTNTPRKAKGTFFDIAWSGSALVAVGYGNRVFSTTDLNEWKWYECEKFTLQDFFSVEWTGREFVAAGTFDSVYTSTDGNNWTSQYISNRQVVRSLLWSDSILFAAGGYDDSASLMLGKFVEATGSAATRQAGISRSGGKRPILYTGNYPPRITEGGWLYTLDGRRVMRIPPAGAGAQAASSRRSAFGGRILRR
jgi:photosystem II stability/assembly factor-like uncharacterized protein